MEDSSALGKYGKDLTKLAKDEKLDPVVGREDEIQTCIEIFSRRTKNNPVLIGEHGVGKTAIVTGIAWKIIEGDAVLSAKRLISLDVGALLNAEPRNFEERMNAIIDEVNKSDGEIMLFVDDIHKIALGDLLRRSISRGELRCIGATTLEEYHKHIDNDPTLARSFSPVYVDQSTVGETISILKGLRQNYEQYHEIKFSDGALETAAVLSDQHITGKFLPAKAIELIDIAAAKVNIQTVSKHIGSEKGKLILDSETEKLSLEGSSEEVIVTDDDIVEVVSQTTKIPKEKLKESEEQKLLHLESEMAKRVVGQVHALKEVIAVVRRSRVGLGNPKRPAASFMFVGPAGVGKTKLAKALAYSLFNTEEALVRFDLSSFHQGGQLIEAVRRRPYSVILLDGIDKAPPELLEVLFVILDEGKIMDAAGRLVNFTNTVIILISNVAPEILLQDPDNKTNKLSYDHLKDKVLSELQLQPELLNRVDESIVFLPLDPDDANHLVRLKVQDLSQKIEQEKNIKIQVTEDALKLLGRWGYDPTSGARQVKRVIQQKVEDELVLGILDEEFQQGDTIIIDKVSSSHSERLTFRKSPSG